MKQALVILTLLGGIAFSAQAHEVWLERNTDGSVKVQFGEPGSEQASAEELASLSAARIFAANAKTPLTATAQANLSQKVYELHKKAFELGETDLATLIRLEQTAVEANRLNSKATIEYAAKVSAYRQAMGLLP